MPPAPNRRRIRNRLALPFGSCVPGASSGSSRSYVSAPTRLIAWSVQALHPREPTRDRTQIELFSAFQAVASAAEVSSVDGPNDCESCNKTAHERGQHAT